MFGSLAEDILKVFLFGTAVISFVIGFLLGGWIF